MSEDIVRIYGPGIGEALWLVEVDSNGETKKKLFHSEAAALAWVRGWKDAEGKK